MQTQEQKSKVSVPKRGTHIVPGPDGRRKVYEDGYFVGYVGREKRAIILPTKYR